MSEPAAPLLLHASCVAIGGAAVVICGVSGAGKSDLALRLIDRGAILVADDCTLVRAQDGRLIASAPETIAGRIEVRGIGIVEAEHLALAEVRLGVDLDGNVDRMPEATSRDIAGIAVPVIALHGFEASAPIKVVLALRRILAEDRP